MKILFTIIRRVFRIASFIIFYMGELILANIRVAVDILTPKLHLTPSILAIEMDVKSDIEVLALNNLITMTPGTLSMDISEDRKTIYVHHMYVDDPEACKQEIKEGFEKRILEISIYEDLI